MKNLKMMRKRKLKNYFKIGILFVGILLSLTNCERDNPHEDTIQSENQEPTFTLKQYSRKNIKKNTKLVSKLKEFDHNLTKNKSGKYFGKNIYNKEYDFTIYTDSATYIQNGDYHSYTFPLVQSADEKMTNILFELNDIGEYDAFLVKYDYTANEFNTLDLNSLSLKTSMKPINLDFNSLSAKTKSAYVCIYSYEYIKTGTRFTNGDSNLIEDVYSWVLTASYCETVLYEDEDYTNYHNNNTATVTIGGTTYGGTGGSATSPMPSPFSSEELMMINVVKSELNLNHSQRLWIDEYQNAQFAFQIYDFLKAEMWAEEAINFSKGQIQLETKIWYTNKNNKWTPQNGKLKGRDDLKYTKVYHTTTESHYLMEDGSYVIESGTEFTLNSDGALARKVTSELFPNESYWYIKHPDVGEWANFLFSENNLADEVELLLKLGAQEFGKSIGRYALPVEEFKILFTGTDFDGNHVNQYVNAGILVVGFIPGGKALKTVKFIPPGVLKWGKVIKKAKGGATTIKSEIINKIVDFGTQSSNNYKLRQILGLVTGDGKHAHHIIPFNFRDLDIVQKAAKADKRFHISEKMNGIPLPSTNHLTGHSAYSTKVSQILNNLDDIAGSDFNKAYNELKKFIEYLDKLIKNNPNKNIGEIADLINY